MIFVSGVHGVGKSYLCNLVKDSVGIKTYSASALISTKKRSRFAKEIMAGKFERKQFSELNLNDPFFDSLKADYPGASSSTGFVQWFTTKAADGKQALIFEDD